MQTQYSLPLYPYLVLSYYCYTRIDDPEDFRKKHHLYCLDNHLLGRIIIAHEGINGTVSGLVQDCEQYIKDLSAQPGFEQTHFTIEKHHAHAFNKLHVRVKREIVHSNLRDIHPQRQKKGAYLTPIEFQAIKQNHQVVILDVRSNYEHQLGKFENSLTLDISLFRDLPKTIDTLKPYQNHTIVTVCTAGIRCEKPSAYLLAQGFHNVYQLHGGIIQYGLDTDGEGFQGKCYVFDNRISTVINKKNPQVIASCYVCDVPSERMINCANPECNRQTVICKPCADALDGGCGIACQGHPKKRPYNGSGCYTKAANGYNPYKGLNRPAPVLI